MEDLVNLLIKHEGIVLIVYLCPAGYKTIGVGRNLETNGLTEEECKHLGIPYAVGTELILLLTKRGITKDEALYLLNNDITRCNNNLHRVAPWFATQPTVVQHVLIDMTFNMGIGGLLNFKNTIALLKQRKYEEASVEMLRSRWATQVGARATELSQMIKTAK